MTQRRTGWRVSASGSSRRPVATWKVATSPVVRPALSALTRDIPAYGAHAARTLLSLIAGERVGPVEDRAPRLVPRGSTGPPPA
ncbi:hypothetical protein [Nonomuraea sp. NPDC048916]|uniref:hypothetical protein n=1 Tax=Nonomuraea sp. NPDC048916 TaxID=3154232 RepID=UPI0033E24411